MFGGDVLDTNLWFLHRGVLQPKSGIGQHFHNYCEEMFVILDGEAQFTIDGRTSTLKGPAGAPARMGHSHAIYNATDKPVEWMNINVTSFRGIYDAFDLGDGRVGGEAGPGPAVHEHAARPGAACSKSPTCRVARAPCRIVCALGPSVFLSTWTVRRSFAAAAGHVGGAPARSPASAASIT